MHLFATKSDITIVHSNPVALESHTGPPSQVADTLQTDLGLD